MASRKMADMQGKIDAAKKVALKEGAKEFPYTDELADEICHMISISPCGLERICKENPHFPSWQTIYKWRNKREDFYKKYMKARSEQVHAYVDKMIDRAADESRDMYVDERGSDRPNPTAVSRDKLVCDTIKWMAAKLNGAVYGDKNLIETRDLTHEEGLDDLDK